MEAAMIGRCHRRTLTAALVILGAGLLQGCAYGTYADASAPCCASPAYGYSGYPAYGGDGYPAYDGYGGAVVSGGAWRGDYYGGTNWRDQDRGETPSSDHRWGGSGSGYQAASQGSAYRPEGHAGTYRGGAQGGGYRPASHATGHPATNRAGG
jgi:hypothetical protein